MNESRRELFRVHGNEKSERKLTRVKKRVEELTKVHESSRHLTRVDEGEQGWKRIDESWRRQCNPPRGKDGGYTSYHNTLRTSHSQ